MPSQIADLVTPLTVAIGVLVGAVAAYALLAIALRYPEDPLLATIVRPICTVYALVYHRLRVVSPSRDPVPPEGPAIVVANHRSGVDPLLLGVITRRHVRFLMAREYYETRGLRWAFRSLGCIPVNRDGNDLGATKAALKALRDGEVIGIFPQGGIREAGGSMEGKAGVALLAVRTGAPVVPFNIHGWPNLDSVLLSLIVPSRTTVTCGPPLRFTREGEQRASREELERITAAILDAIINLGPLSAAGRPVPSPPQAKAL